MESKKTYKFAKASFFHNTVQNFPNSHFFVDTRDRRYADFDTVRHCVKLGRQLMYEAGMDREKFTLGEVEKNIINSLYSDLKTLFEHRRRNFVLILSNKRDILYHLFQDTTEIFKTAVGPDTIEIECSDFDARLADFIVRRPEFQLDEDRLVSLRIALRYQSQLFDERVREAYILIEGTDVLFPRYPYMNSVASPGKAIRGFHPMPNEVIDQKLFIGNAAHAKDKSVFEMLHITHVLNSTRDVPNYFENEGITYLRAAVDDLDETKITHCFEEVSDFLEKVVSTADSVGFIHCKIGKSRSAAFTIMFLMKKFSWSYEEAFTYMKSRRDFIYPNPGFVLQLEAFEKTLRATV